MTFLNRGFGWAIAAVISTSVGLGTGWAADMPVKALPPAVVPFSWTGFYVGGYVGGAGADSVSSPDGTNPSTVVNGATTYLPGVPSICDGGTPGLKTGCVANYGMGSSVIAGGTAGYNWQFGKMVAGVEGEFGYMHLSGSGTLPYIFGAPCGSAANPCVSSFSTVAGDWYGTLAARLGVTANALNPAWSDHVLLYAKGGGAVTRLSTAQNSVAGPLNVAASFTGASDIWGWVAGAGVEWAINQHWSVKAEYEYLGFNQSVTGCGILPLGASGAGGRWCTSTGIDGIQTGKIGVNYRFGGPVVAKY
jgi:outer membrane immunogenic protein